MNAKTLTEQIWEESDARLKSEISRRTDLLWQMSGAMGTPEVQAAWNTFSSACFNVMRDQFRDAATREFLGKVRGLKV
mgnify:FL=1